MSDTLTPGCRCRSKLPQTTQVAITRLSQKLSIQIKNADLARRPLELHHHKPLAIKTAIPKFEDSYNPNKHYDPDHERTEAAKLKKEFKRERKGAIRELRRDAKVVARDSLREKKEKDAAYEKVCNFWSLFQLCFDLRRRHSETSY
jgi:nucleolar protein 14